ALGGPDGLGTGLLVAANTFEDLTTDAILLDGATATLGLEGEPPNTFEGGSGVPLRWQRCGETLPPDITLGGDLDASCRSSVTPVGPPLEWNAILHESAVAL
ncbi:MAG: hypothetical protein KDA24_18295, partial [Deltaproteobacteria bacterium]|nr:hypothetical protein [Deltaproteobacteria bacterium]